MNHSQQQYQHPQSKGFQMPPEPSNISSVNSSNSNSTIHNGSTKTNPATRNLVKVTPQLLTSIKNSRKGKLPSGLAKYMKSKKGGK